jgi:hypothetical protein
LPTERFPAARKRLFIADRSLFLVENLPPNRILKFKVGEKIFLVDKQDFFRVSGFFGARSSLLRLSEYEVQSQVPPSVFEEFVEFFHGGRIVVSDDNYGFLRLLAEEFGFGALTVECDIFQASREPLSSDIGFPDRSSVYEEVCVGTGHRVTITVRGWSLTYKALRSQKETERFGEMLWDAKPGDIEIEGIEGNDRVVEKAVAAVHSNTWAELGDYDTKKPFLVMVLWKLQKWLCGWSIDSAIYCLNRLDEVAPTDFDKARLLLLSQCRPVSPPDFVPRSNADFGLIASAIMMLQAEKNGRRGDACQLLQQLKATGRYEYELETE